MWAIVPLKSLESAKRRLARFLAEDERRDLMLAMARDVLGALCQSRRLDGILIVSRTTEADALARAFSTERFAESPDADLPAAIRQASAHLAEHFAASGVMIVPADMPLIDANEIDDLIAHHDHVTVIPDAEHVGTNCLMLSPPDAIDPVFDGRSFRPHVDAAFAKGFTPRIGTARSMALDIDTVEDLAALVERGAGTQAGTFLERSGIARRIRSADNARPTDSESGSIR